MDKISLEEIENYKNSIIPKLLLELSDENKSNEELLVLYNLYDDILCMLAPYDFGIFNDYLEFEEDKSQDNKGFHHHRKREMEEVYESLNQMEVNNKYDILLVSLPPRVGKTTYGIRFLSWICGKYPEYTQLATSYSDSITTSFYNGVIEVMANPRYTKCFADGFIVNQNAKREEIWLNVRRRYPTIAFVPIGGSVTGRVEANNYLYADDIVSGIEEAMSLTRLEKLWQIFSVNFYQRKKEGCKLVMIATRWSVHDPMGVVERVNSDNPRCKVVNIPCYDEEGESNFDFPGGFSKDYYIDIEKSIEKISFEALYKCNPIEREGLLYHAEDMEYYFELPNEACDTTIAVCDSKNMGKDYVSSIVAKVYGDVAYIEDVVYNNGLPEITIPLVANLWYNNGVVRGEIEANNGGGYYAQLVDDNIKKMGGKTSIRTFFSTNNKKVRIITYSDFAVKHLIFKDPSLYSKNSEYSKFMTALFSWTQVGNNKFDDSVDSLSMLSSMFQSLNGNSVKILDRKKLGI